VYFIKGVAHDIVTKMFWGILRQSSICYKLLMSLYSLLLVV
jgi:hypothetical protein